VSLDNVRPVGQEPVGLARLLTLFVGLISPALQLVPLVPPDAGEPHQLQHQLQHQGQLHQLLPHLQQGQQLKGFIIGLGAAPLLFQRAPILALRFPATQILLPPFPTRQVSRTVFQELNTLRLVVGTSMVVGP